jgi:hypothetical protein
MAVTEIKEALRSAADTVAKYVRDVGVLHVETQTVEVGNAGEPVLAARTVIKLDGDNSSVIPAVMNQQGKWEVDTVLYDLHMQNVQKAIEYRSKLMESMLALLRGTGGGQ